MIAQPKTPEDVELARIKANLEKARLICSTVVSCVAIVAGVGCIGIISWVVVLITDKPAWLEIALAILGIGGAPSLLTWRLYLRLKQRVDPPLKAESTEGDATP